MTLDLFILGYYVPPDAPEDFHIVGEHPGQRNVDIDVKAIVYIKYGPPDVLELKVEVC